MKPNTGETSGLPWWEKEPRLRGPWTRAGARWVVRLAKWRGRLGAAKCVYAAKMRKSRAPKWARLGCTKREYKGFCRDQINRARGHHTCWLIGAKARIAMETE